MMGAVLLGLIASDWYLAGPRRPDPGPGRAVLRC